jgi:hypothetical protein
MLKKSALKWNTLNDGILSTGKRLKDKAIGIYFNKANFAKSDRKALNFFIKGYFCIIRRFLFINEVKLSGP